MEYLEIYTDCWKLKPDSRPSINQIILRLQSMLLERHDSDKNSVEKYLNHDVFKIWVQNAITGSFFTYIGWDELTEMSRIDQGTYGTVDKARWSKTNDYIVLKTLTYSYSSTDIQREIQMQNKGHTCDNVIRFLGITQSM
jgi:hypothetical protein